MSNLFLLLFLASFVCLIAGLIKPSLFNRFFQKEMTRKKVGLFFGSGLIIFFVLFGVTAEPSEQGAENNIVETKTETSTPDLKTKKESDTKPEAVQIKLDEPEVMTDKTPEPEVVKIIKNPTIEETLKQNAFDKWGDDYEMVKYEYDKQLEAYNWVMKQDNYPAIMSKAKQKWGSDYEMVKYEYEKQVEAYKAL